MTRGYKITRESGEIIAADLRKRRFAYTPKRAHHNRVPDGGMAGIEFTIDSVTTASTGPYTGLKVATVTVEGASSGLSDLIGDQVEVVDHSGCVFDLAEADLVDVYGWATEKIFKSLAEDAGPNDLTPLHWCAQDRCCTDADGG